MIEKEIAELRRRLRPDKSGVSHVRGCYVNANGEIISQFDQSLGIMSQDENERIFTVLRKTLSGGLGKNLLDIEFETAQVAHGEEHRLLMRLRDSSLEDEEAVQLFFQRVIQSLSMEDNYLILLARDAYDVPFKGRDGDRFDEGSSEVFTYILCSICPVKQTKPALSFQENSFRTLGIDWVVAAPEVGFLFPAFDDRAANLYNALYYTKDTTRNQDGFIDAIFRSHAPMPAAEQQETFRGILAETLEDDCSYSVLQGVHNKVREMVEVHKASKEPTPLTLSKSTVKHVLEECGVADDRLKDFDGKFDARFGADAELHPKNLMDSKQFELKTPDVTIKVNPERSDLIRTEMIHGTRYILIRADEGVEVNGVNIHID